MNYHDTISYDPESGVFRWLGGRRGVRAGAKAGTVSYQGYVIIMLGRKKIRAHRLAWFKVHGVWPDGQIDHINGDRADNRMCNLRVVDGYGNAQNLKSAHKDSSHGLLGASWHKGSKRWQAKIMTRGEWRYLGRFDTADAAHAAYMQAKKILHISGG